MLCLIMLRVEQNLPPHLRQLKRLLSCSVRWSAVRESLPCRSQLCSSVLLIILFGGIFGEPEVGYEASGYDLGVVEPAILSRSINT